TNEEFKPKDIEVHQSVSTPLIVQDEPDSNLIEMEGANDAFDSEMWQICEHKVAALKRMVNHLEQELSANNLNHVSRVVSNMDKVFKMLNDIETAQNRRRRNPTWKGSTPWTLYLQ
ncbi:33165_t:CDS:1, partial [Gigaspora margarita]